MTRLVAGWIHSCFVQSAQFLLPQKMGFEAHCFSDISLSENKYSDQNTGFFSCIKPLSKKFPSSDLAFIEKIQHCIIAAH